MVEGCCNQILGEICGSQKVVEGGMVVGFGGLSWMVRGSFERIFVSS